MVSSRLKTELETYERHKSRLVAEADGKHVLISGERILGHWDTYEDALDAGYATCGLHTPFAVKQISALEQVHFISREFSAC